MTCGILQKSATCMLDPVIHPRGGRQELPPNFFKWNFSGLFLWAVLQSYLKGPGLRYLQVALLLRRLAADLSIEIDWISHPLKSCGLRFCAYSFLRSSLTCSSLLYCSTTHAFARREKFILNRPCRACSLAAWPNPHRRAPAFGRRLNMAVLRITLHPCYPLLTGSLRDTLQGHTLLTAVYMRSVRIRLLPQRHRASSPMEP